MKSIMLFAACTFAFAACGPLDEGDGSTATASQAIIGWTPWVSEEQPNGTTCAPDNTIPTYAGCSGSYCDSMRLFCGTLPPGFTKGTQGYWSNYISEESPGNSEICFGLLDGVKATGQYSDNVSFYCNLGNIPSWGVNCAWTPWFSEEQGSLKFKVNSQSNFNAVALGFRCSGSFCDNMAYYVCEPKCRTNADCFGACVNGVCTVG